MRKIFFTLVAPFAFLFALSAQITQYESDEIILERMSQETQPYIIYAKEDVQTAMTISTSAEETIELDYACWVYYISYDDVGRYLLVNENNGNILEVNTKNSAEPEDLTEWRTTIGIISEDEFCSYVNLENINKTLPAINKFLKELSGDLDDEQQLEALTTWLKSFPCITDATILCASCIETLPPQSEILISFDEDGLLNALVLDISMSEPLEACCYHVAQKIDDGGLTDLSIQYTPCQQSREKSSDLSNSVDVEFTNEGVQIVYNNFEVTCDFTTVNATHTFENGFLNITQQGYPNQAKCVCYTDVSYTINGISQNEVNVIFINGVQVYSHNGNEESYNDVIISKTEYENAPDFPVSIIGLTIVNNCLKIKFSASGCDGSSWNVKLIGLGNYDKSNPPQTTLRLSLDNKEECLAVITKEVSFNLEPLKEYFRHHETNKLYLNILGKGILYEY
jgi:hypothetical protein